ncbi:MAG: TadE family protein [Pseudomonadota bacterium]
MRPNETCDDGGRPRGLRARLNRWLGCQDGSSSVEFVILFPIYMTIFSSAFELGLHMTKQVVLDRSLDLTVRALRLGTFVEPSHTDLRNAICSQAELLNDCRNNLLIELSPINQGTWALPASDAQCVDKEEDIAPPDIDDIGQSNQLMLIRACALVEPFFPTTGLALQFEKVQGKYYRIIATSAFVNEPG